jgi:hypothetical protein
MPIFTAGKVLDVRGGVGANKVERDHEGGLWHAIFAQTIAVCGQRPTPSASLESDVATRAPLYEFLAELAAVETTRVISGMAALTASHEISSPLDDAISSPRTHEI